MAETQEVVDTVSNTDYVAGSDAGDAGGAEDQARAMGWVPKEEFDGRPEKWTDAEQFLEVHSRNNGALRKALDRQAEELTALKGQMKAMDSAHKRIFEIQIKKAKEEFDQQIAFLKAQKKEALRAGEFDTAEELDEQLEAARTRGPDLPEVSQTTQNPNLQPNWRSNKILADWADRNPWFEKDEDLSLFAGSVGQKVRSENPTMPFPELLLEVENRVKKAFPSKFAESGRPNKVEGATPGATSGTNSRSTYASLPKEAKEFCDEAVTEGGITQKQWVDMYYGYDDRRKAR